MGRTIAFAASVGEVVGCVVGRVVGCVVEVVGPFHSMRVKGGWTG